MASLQSILRPQVLTNVISRQAAASDWLINLFGVQPGGANELNFGHGREGSYNIFNNVRTVGKIKAPGTAAGISNPNPVGSVPFTYPRLHDSVSLLAETVHNIGRISDPASRDVAGRDYVMRQEGYLAQKAVNFRKAMLAGTLRDSLYMVRDGDSYYFVFDETGATVPVIQVPTQMPAGNKGNLDMLGAGDIIDAKWDVATTDIPGQLGKINAAFQQLNGGHLNTIICPWAVWNAVIQNDTVGAIHGAAAPPFVAFERETVEPVPGVTMRNVFRARLNTLPDTTWYVTDEGLELGTEGNEVYEKLVPDKKALFIGTDPMGGTIGCYLGSEPIAEYDAGPETVKTGLNSWSNKRSNPTSTDLYALDNALTVNHIPDSTAIGDVLT